jgi:hypothetical protein
MAEDHGGRANARFAFLRRLWWWWWFEKKIRKRQETSFSRGIETEKM